jgi:hypothetical protein
MVAVLQSLVTLGLIHDVGINDDNDDDNDIILFDFY